MLAADKAALRSEIEARRGVAHDALSDTAGHAIRDHFLGVALPTDITVIAAYWPFRTEIDPRPLMLALHARGYRVVLPVVVKKDAPLKFRLWGPGATLVKAGLGGLVPDVGAPELEPDLLLVPMLAYDDTGHRLGYGGGFYDRTLEGLRAEGPVLAIGFAYAAQEAETLPHDPLDQPLDMIVTEAGVIEVGKA